MKMTLGAEFDAMFREAIKDVRQTLNDSYFGRGEHAPEMGSPLNPTPQLVTRALDGFDSQLESHAARAAPAIERPQMEME